MDNKNFLKPTAEFATFRELTPEFLLQNGIRGLLCDIDDTLVTHNFPLPTGDVSVWKQRLDDANISLCFVSNNNYKRVAPFAKALGAPFISMAGKPSTRALSQAVAVLGLKKEETAFLGDQIYTDVKGANLFGIPSYKVAPVGNRATLWIKIKRKMEKRLEK